jgi:hypothetical protein
MQRLSAEGQVWVGKYFENLNTYSRSGLKDFNAMENAVQSLEFLLQRCPEQGPFVQRLSLQAAMICRHQKIPEIIQRLAKNGLDAYVTQNKATQGDALVIIQFLLTLSIESYLEVGNRSEGVIQLKKLKAFIETRQETSTIGRWIEANQLYVSAKLDEEILENYKAFDSYQKAIAIIRLILENEALFKTYKQEWIDLCLGEEMKKNPAQGEDIYAVPVLDIKKVYIHSHLGLIRCQQILTDNEQQLANALNAKKATELFGLPPGADPFSTIPLLSYLPLELSKEHCQWILTKGLQQTMQIPGLEGILENPVTRHIGELIQRNLKLKIEEQQVDWEVACRIGVASSLERDGKIQEASHAAFEAFKLCRDKESLARVIATGFLVRLLHDYQNPQLSDYLKYFTESLALAIAQNNEYWENSYYRSLLEKPFLAVLEKEIVEYTKVNDPSQSTKTSVFLDAMRSQKVPDFWVVLKSIVGMPGLGDNVDKALDNINDYLGRILHALPENALVIIIQAVSKGTGILLISKRLPNPLWVIADELFSKAQKRLNETVDETLKELQVMPDGTNDVLIIAGKELFEAQPSAIKDAIRNHQSLLLVPDFSINGDITPFELMYDEGSFIGTSKVISRFISLEHLARTLDSTYTSHQRPRAIVTSIDNPTSVEADKLQAASIECQTIRQLFCSSHFDVPESNTEQLSAKYFTDRLSFVDVLHIAAHGESLKGDEWLLLPNDDKFVVDDLYAKKQRSIPFVYLNTCHLGQTRYMGSGISRGFAFNLIELGAPALIANTIEMLDSQTARLSVGFYRRALSMPVGEALLETRKYLLSKNISPVIWGSAILFGNPFHNISKQHSEKDNKPDISCELLDAFLGTQMEKLEEIYQKATNVLKMSEYHPKLEAAFLLIFEIEELEKEEKKKTSKDFDKLVKLADALHHLPSQGYIRFREFEWTSRQGNDKITYSLIKELIPYLEALSSLQPMWKIFLSNAQSTKKRLELASEKREPSMPGSGAPVSDPTMNAFLDAIYASQESSKSLYGEVEIREEKKAEDIIWNAVILGHPNKFEDMKETIAFTRQFCNKLRLKSDTFIEDEKEMIPLMAGMLRYLWSTQNLSYLDPAFAEGQAATLMTFIEDIKMNLSTLKISPAFKLMKDFLNQVDETLLFLDSLKWEEIYNHLDVSFTGLNKKGVAVLSEIKQKYNNLFPLCSAYISGAVIEKNIFSYIDGSVPEDYEKRMSNLYISLSRDQESDFYSYLYKGFEAVRNKKPSDVERWTMEDSMINQ